MVRWRLHLTSKLVFFVFLLKMLIRCVNASMVFHDNFKESLGAVIFQNNTRIHIQSLDRTYNKSFTFQNHIFNVTESPITHKKWQVGRVSRKQYEIVNMLWRKTKTFINSENTTSSYYSQNMSRKQNNKNHQLISKTVKYPNLEPFRITLPRPVLQSSTSSYIEFYYLDDIDDRIKRKDSTTVKLESKSKHKRFPTGNNSNLNFLLSHYPFFAFHVNESPYKKINVTSLQTARNISISNHEKAKEQNVPDPHHKISMLQNPHNKVTDDGRQVGNYNTKRFLKNTLKSTRNDKTFLNNTFNLIGKVTFPSTQFILDNSLKIRNKEDNNATTMRDLWSYYLKSTTVYDKIKFFEIYDKHTRIPLHVRQKPSTDSIHNESKTKDIISEWKIHKNSYTDKHEEKNIENNKSEILTDNFFVVVPDLTKKENMNLTGNRNDIMEYKTTTSVPNIQRKYFNKIPILDSFSNMSKSISWSNYPFVAVYVHEPFQVHCDSAGITPHWLVAAGSCLSRHRRDPSTEGRSAFVTYCGDSWRQPERITYVKYSLVHPRYHPREKTRRHLYNIGLIQVVSSMASTCSNWSPISLMSHQFVVSQDGSVAASVGWGLDRYGTRYSSRDLPQWPLMIYEGLVYSDTCPGNKEYSKAKRLEDEGGVTNLYCLSLPPYSGEETDPVHGSLLLVGGKLIALYLQEERRFWGEQSALYTGVWRLIPWLLNMAREPDEIDSFPVEI